MWEYYPCFSAKYQPLWLVWAILAVHDSMKYNKTLLGILSLPWESVILNTNLTESKELLVEVSVVHTLTEAPTSIFEWMFVEGLNQTSSHSGPNIDSTQNHHLFPLWGFWRVEWLERLPHIPLWPKRSLQRNDPQNPIRKSVSRGFFLMHRQEEIVAAPNCHNMCWRCFFP